MQARRQDTSFDSIHPAPRALRSVLIVDPLPVSQRALANGFFALGAAELWAAADLPVAASILEREAPDLLITELRLPGGSYLDLLAQARRLRLDLALVIATASPSVAAAARAMRQGCAGFFSRPVTAGEIVRAVYGPEAEAGAAERPLTLDEAIWEYISRTLDAQGSIAGAARSLGLERRSLKRMLTKYAPPPRRP